MRESVAVYAIFAGLGFALGLVDIWVTVRALHKKDLKRVVTGRASFDTNRYLFGLLVALTVSVVKMLVNRFIVQIDMPFQPPGW